MINNLRKRFIAICAISIFAVVIVIFILISALNVSSMNRTMDTLTDRISEGNGKFPDFVEGRPPSPPTVNDRPASGIINPETPYSTRHFTVWFNPGGETVENTEFIASITDESAHEYAHKAVDSNKDRGWISNYRYKVYSTNDSVAVVFVDATMSRVSLLQSLSISALVLTVVSLFILLLIILLSGRVMQPIAESYEKQKQFVTDANHELKTPLTLILTNLDIAEAELGKNEWLDDIRSEGQRMADLVNQLVSLSRMDEGIHSLNTANLSLGKITFETVAEFEALSMHGGKAISTDIDEDICYIGDEVLLRRLVGILMDNAIKYCDAGGEISVTLKQKNKHIYLTVENTYSALDSLELERLFDRFYRADKARTYHGGYGIGLSLAKSIVENHRGQISAYKADSDVIGFKIVL